MPHHRARLTPRGREMVVRRVVDDGMSFAQAAAWGNVSKSTVWEWVRRWRAASADERESLACLLERSSRPHRSPSRCPAGEEQRICELRRRTGWSPRAIAVEVGRPHSTVHQVLRRGGCSRPERVVGSAGGAWATRPCWPDWSGFLPPPLRTVHAVLAHTALRRSRSGSRSPQRGRRAGAAAGRGRGTAARSSSS